MFKVAVVVCFLMAAIYASPHGSQKYFDTHVHTVPQVDEYHRELVPHKNHYHVVEEPVSTSQHHRIYYPEPIDTQLDVFVPHGGHYDHFKRIDHHDHHGHQY
ncbi:uncharacterized protein LOC114336034 [Diabrotica virgifera virgifera]|uniref:Uncharacterized protein LOC114336034 n=1 Tax=Diabrotica virgifera virgifera TaxID=50390 RepID=A0A6P7FZT5_DIAVI|nr:uncharacterized protein LOC114336034 [Diabrotica virgifera virgifera]